MFRRLENIKLSGANGIFETSNVLQLKLSVLDGNDNNNDDEDDADENNNDNNDDRMLWRKKWSNREGYCRNRERQVVGNQ